MIKLANAADAIYAAQYEIMRQAGAAHRRAEAFRAYTERGLPNRRVETWHYTDLKAALAKPAPLASRNAFSEELARTHDSVRFVTLDGKFRPDLSDLERLPGGLRVLSLHEALASDDPAITAALWPDDAVADDVAVALNGALMQDGVVILVAPGMTLTHPIEFVTLVSASEPQSVFTRSALIVGAGASVRLIETPCAPTRGASNPTQLNHLLSLRLEKDSTVDMLTHIAGFSAGSVDVLSLIAHLGPRTRLNAHLLIEGGGLLRRQVFAALDGEDAHAAFNGVTLARGRQHADTTLVIDHRQPRGTSHERFRTILDEQAVGVFQGKIVVRPGAQKTDGVMQSKAILLSDGATMNNKPELEIFADDVKCGHGATCGRLDGEQLFYLMARGLPRREAESLLLEGFANEALADIADETLREFVTLRIGDWLTERSPA
jgi:Fe-S cluster assembly protein SufD